MNRGRDPERASLQASRDAPPRRDAVAYALLPALGALFHLVTIGGYGIFRDELYYLACAERLDWGYVDHPPLSLVILSVTRAILGDSVAAIRIPAILASACTVVLSVSLARALGGRAFAQRLTALCVATFPIGLGLAGIFSMNAFDLVFWIAILRIVAHLLAGADPRWWLAFGGLAGLGLQNKISVLFVGFGVFAGMLVAGRVAPLRSRWFWLGGLTAFVLFAPHVVWQIVHGWPTLEFMQNARLHKMAEMTTLAFAGEVVLNAGPLLLPVWLAGVAFLLFARESRPARPLGWAFVVIFAVMAATGAKPYYMAAAFPFLFAAGGVAWERWSERDGGLRLRRALVVLAALNFVVLAPFAKAILPVDVFVAYAQAIGIVPSLGERNAIGRLPQHFADQHGWRSLVEQVARVRDGLAEAERSGVCIFARNYGQAGAIDHFGPALGLPRAVAGHNSYWHWGPGSCGTEVWIVIGGTPEEVTPLFVSVEPAATFACAECMPHEDGKTIWIGRGLREPIEDLWPRVKRFI